MRGNYQKVTPIDEIDLRQVDPMQQSEHGGENISPQLQRFIRPQSHGMPQKLEYYEPDNANFQQIDQAYSGNSPSLVDTSIGYKSRNIPYKISPPLMEPYEPAHSHYNCRDLYEHVKECDICKRFYRNDNTVYLIIIAILLVACALLAKKVMNI